MAIYNNAAPDSAVRSVEFIPTAEGNIAFFHLSALAGEEAIAGQLASLGQQVTARTQVKGQTVLVTQGTRSAENLLKSLAAQGLQLSPLAIKNAFNPWWWRGFTSFVGQSLTLISGFRSKSNDRGSLITFAGTNLVANVGNMVFGAQRKDDPHQLRVLKEQVNKVLTPYIQGGRPLPTPEESGIAWQKDGSSSDGSSFLQRNSVSAMEIGLRTFGSVALVTPPRQNIGTAQNPEYKIMWGKALRTLPTDPKGAFGMVRQKSDFTFWYGVLMVTGKITSFFAKEKDPYNPKPHTAFDTFRENVAFRASSVIEGTGAGIGVYDRFHRQKQETGKRDWFGSIGNMIFIGGYIIRLFAPYGSKEVNMKALYAHAAQALSDVPEDKRLQAMTEISGMLTSHFDGKLLRADGDKQGKPLSFAESYAQIAHNFERYYGTSPGPVITPEVASPAKIFATDDKKASDRIPRAPAASHQERARMSEPAAAHAI